MNVIILDGHLKSALATTRSLGKRGIKVVCAAERNTAMSLHSIYCSQKFIYQSPVKDKQNFIHSIIGFAKNLDGKPLIYAFSDETILPLNEYRKELSEFVTIVLPKEESIDVAFDKKKTLALAKSLDIPYVNSYKINNLVEAKKVSEIILYPAVVKQQSSCIWKDDKGKKGTAEYVFDEHNLIEKVSERHEATNLWPIIQEFIQGDEYGVEMLCDGGEPYAIHVHKRIRSLNPSGGAAVVKETIFNTEVVQTMEKYATKLARELNWEGPIMVEFKMNNKEGQVQLMEINGRFWGSLPLAIFAGIDFPYIFYEHTLGNKPLQDKVECIIGTVSRHFLGDLHNLINVLFDRNKIRSFIYPSRLQALVEFFSFSDKKYDVWSKEDMKPFFMEIIDILKRKT